MIHHQDDSIPPEARSELLSPPDDRHATQVSEYRTWAGVTPPRVPPSHQSHPRTLRHAHPHHLHRTRSSAAPDHLGNTLELKPTRAVAYPEKPHDSFAHFYPGPMFDEI